MGEPPIKVYSWPSLWVYWPMYVALALCKDVGLYFTLEVEGKSDEAIRNRLDAHLTESENSFALALCEPGPIGIQEDKNFARIPLLWRLPHWIIKQEHADDESPGAVLCYPQNATSGDYARALFGTTLEYKELIANRPVSDQLAQMKSENPAVFSFTPYHCFEKGLWASRLFPGPDRDVTALLVPIKRGRGAEIADIVLENTKRVLHWLALTDGDAAQINDIIQAYQSRVEKFYPAFAFPQGDDLARAITEYVRHGCYFPYRVVSSALSGELRRIFEKTISEAAKEAQQRASNELLAFLGTGRDWSDLSFAERKAVLGSGPKGETFIQRLLHVKRAEVRRLLSKANVSTAPILPQLTPISLNRNRQLIPPTCLNETDAEICWKPGERPPTASHEDCFACTLASSPPQLVRRAKVELERRLMNQGIAVEEIESCITGAKPISYVCWDDVKEFVGIWINESRPATRLAVHMCVEKDRCCFGIYVKGDTTSGSKMRDASQKLARWAEKHVHADRHIEWCGFWKRNEDPDPVYTLIGGTPMECLRDRSDFDFGYMAVFSWRSDENTHS